MNVGTDEKPSRLGRILLGICSLWLLASLGCSESAIPSPNTARKVTFHRDVAPLLHGRCASCHRPNGAAPFNLLTYEDARRRARQIAEVTRSRFMPPWLPEGGQQKIHGERRLTEGEIELLANWAANGAVEGDPHDAPSMPEFPGGWQLGKPDLVIESPPYDLPADGPNRFRNFVLSVPGDATHWIKAVELRPLNSRVMHHARLGIDTNNESVRRDAADPEVGYEGMAWGQDPPGQIITWTPGMTADEGTAGAAWQLSPDEKLVLHAHLQPSGKTETIRFRVGIYYADAPPTIHPTILRIGSRDIDVPAEEPRHPVGDSYTLPIDADVHFVFPHAHALCREILLEARLPDGTRNTLLSIPHFDQNWHDVYRFSSPVRLPHGTRLETRFIYDNTRANAANPNDPPRRIVYGSNADDEMGDFYLQVTPVDPTQLAVLTEHYNDYELKSKIVGYRKSLELHPDDPWSAEALASCYVADKQPTEAIRLLEARPGLLQESVQANVILAMAYFARGDLAAAEQRLRDALARDDQFSLAWLGLGQVFVAKSEFESAERAFRRAVALAPRSTIARLELIDLLVQSERLPDAAALCRAAIELAPADYRPELKLANVLAQQRQYAASLEHFAAARELAPFLYSPQASLAIACYQLGHERRATQLLHDALHADADDPVPHCFLGQIARRNSELQEAGRFLQRASELSTPLSWPESHRRQFLKLVYQEQLLLADQLQDEALARQAASAWLQIEPDKPELRELVRQLDENQPAN